MKYRIEILRNGEGDDLAYFSPIDEHGEVESGYRIAGPKAWGGAAMLASIDISEADLFECIKSYAPNVFKAIKKS